MSSISNAWKVLTQKEKLSVIISAAIRLSLVALDILGVLFIGIAVALASGTTTAPTSATGQILAYLEQLNLGNPYALVAGASLGFFILKGILAILLNSQIARFFSNLESKKSAHLYEKILFGSLDVKERWTNKQLVHGLIPGMQTAFGSTLIHASAVLGEVFMVVGIAIFLGFKDLNLFIATAIFFASIGFVMHRLISKKSTALGVEGTQLLLQATTMADDSLNAIRTIRSGKNQYLFVNKFAELRINLARNAGRMTIISILPRYITEIALMIAAGALIAQRSVFGENAIPADTIAVFLAGAFRIVASMLTLQGSLSAIGHASGVTQVTFDLLDEYQETENDVNIASIHSNSREVLHLKNVSFSYSGSDRPTVKDANLSLKRGDYLAIVGASGQGKSTLLDLLMGLRQPSSGQITLEGKSPDQFSRESPGSVAYLSQKVPIFPGTISQNVALEFEPESINLKRVFESLADSELLDWVLSLPDGVETTISSDTRALSGGEAQRLGLARVLYQNPTLLLLDEPTSALDSKTAQSVMATIEKLKGKTTILLITHSLQATRGANKFARMRDGSLEMVEGPDIS